MRGFPLHPLQVVLHCHQQSRPLSPMPVAFPLTCTCTYSLEYRHLFFAKKSPSFMAAYATFGYQVGLSILHLNIYKCSHLSVFLNLAFQTIYPTMHYCITLGCTHNARLMLKKSQSQQAVLFTMSQLEGAIPVWSTHLYCECK